MRVAPPAYMTPPTIARMLKIKPDRVIEFIRTGELRGINVARRGSSRPRFRISPEALAAFEAARSEAPLPKPIRRRPQPAQVIPFY